MDVWFLYCLRQIHPKVVAETLIHRTGKRYSSLLLYNFGERVQILASISSS